MYRSRSKPFFSAEYDMFSQAKRAIDSAIFQISGSAFFSRSAQWPSHLEDPIQQKILHLKCCNVSFSVRAWFKLYISFLFLCAFPSNWTKTKQMNSRSSLKGIKLFE